MWFFKANTTAATMLIMAANNNECVNPLCPQKLACRRGFALHTINALLPTGQVQINKELSLPRPAAGSILLVALHHHAHGRRREPARVPLGRALIATDCRLQLESKDEAYQLKQEAEKDIDTALVMIRSGVTAESAYHLTKALTRVTTIGQQSMTFLVDEGLL